jgi:filamentous hemagglutinin
MNSGIYRLVFSDERRMLVSVEEHASSHGGGRRWRRKATVGLASNDSRLSRWLAARAIVLATLCAWGMQPFIVEAQATLPMTPDRTSANRPVIGVSASGLPLVNIVAPNPAGVSLNSFTQYNVGSKGAVIVNTPRSAQTQIAGWVPGNPLMGHAPARVIINQVTSGNPTRLLGMTEIAGGRANLVIANPAGITCSGCGFINTPRVSLATAHPAFNADGSLAGFDVRRGRLGVSGAGLDARGSAIDLVARAMQINGEIWADTITATAGANRVAYAENVAMAQAGEGDAPGIAIDVQLLGGMYANSVRLIGTEAGVGVHALGVVSSLTGSIELSANGDVTIESTGRMQAAGGVGVTAPNLRNDGTIVARQAVRLGAAASLHNSGVIATLSNADIRAAALTNSGDIVAGVVVDGRPSGPGSVTLNGVDISSSGRLAAGDNVNVTGATVSLDRGAVYAASALNLSGELSLTTRGAIATAFNATLKSGGAFINDAGVLDALAEGKVDALSVSNRAGSVTGDTLTVAAGDVDNVGGDLVGRARTHVSSNNLKNDSGRIGSLTDALHVLASGQLTNVQGSLLGASGLSLEAESIASNRDGRIDALTGNARITTTHELNNAAGTLGAGDTLTIAAENLNNGSGSALGSVIDIAVDGQLNNTKGRIASTDKTKLKSETLINQDGVTGSVDGTLSVETTKATDNARGKLVAGGDVLLTNTGLINASGTVSGETVSLQSGTGFVDNTNGVIGAARRLDSDSSALDNRSGLIQSGGGARLETHEGVFDNRAVEGGETGGRVMGQGVTLSAGEVKNSSGLIASSDTTRVSAQSVENDQGAILSHGALNLEAVGDVSNVAGRVAGDADVTVKGKRIDNTRGAVYAGKALNVTGDTILNSETKDATLAPAHGGIALPAGMEGETVSLTAKSGIDNAAGSIRSDRKTELAALDINNTDGAITSSGRVLVDSNATLKNTRGEINGERALELSAGALNNDGRIESRGKVAIKTRGDLTNVGSIVAGNDLEAQAQGDVSNRGTITARGVASVTGQRIENGSTGEITGDRGTHVRAAQSLINTGLIDGGATRVDADNKVANHGRIYGDSIAIDAPVVSNGADAQGVGAAIASRGDIDIGAKEIVNQDDSLIYASNDIRTGGDLDADGKASTALSERFTNNGSVVDAAGRMTIAAKRFENLNADFQTRKVTTDAGRRIWYTTSGVTERIDPADVYFYHRNSHDIRPGTEYRWSLDDDDQKVLLLPSTKYSAAEYAKYTLNGIAGTIDRVSYPAKQSRFDGEYELKGDVNRVGAFRSVPDEMWAKFGVAPPPLPPDPAFIKPGNYEVQNWTQRRELGADWYSLNVPIAHAPRIGKTEARHESCVTATAESCRPFKQWYDELTGSYAALAQAVNAYNRDVAGRSVDRWTIYDVNVMSTRDHVVATQPGRILAGRDLTIDAESGVNDKSQLLAGGRAYAHNAIKDNSQPKGIETFAGAGEAIATWVESGGAFRGDTRKHVSQPYAAPIPQREIDLPIAAVPLANRDPVKRVAVDASAARGVSGVGPTGVLAKPLDGRVQVSPTAALDAVGARGPDLDARRGAPEIRMVEANFQLPSNALYQVSSDPGSRYLIETDSRFTNRKNWLSSDRMVAALGVAPALVQKRLGDGFFEQQLVQKQIIEATGQRFIGGYTDNQTQYQALMANGLRVANRFEMNVGTGLTDDQMSALTEDIVWLVNQEVELADGTRHTVLTPQVYLRADQADVTGTGSIVAGESVVLDNEGAFANSGTIASRRATIVTADSIVNVGTVAGQSVRADAKEDLSNLGGVIQGKTVRLSAGRDVNLSSTTSFVTTENGSATAFDRISAIRAETLVVQAERDLNTDAAQIDSTGDILLSARRDANFAAIRQRSEDHVQWDETNKTSRGGSVDTGTSIVSGGNLTILAGRDLNAVAASASAQNDLLAIAGRDVNLSAGEQSASAYDEHRVKENDLLSSKSTHTIDASGYTDALGTVFSGNTVGVAAGKNLTANAVTIAGAGDVSLQAGNDLRITTAGTATREYQFKDVKRSGLGSAGAGISYGTNQTTDTSRDATHGALGSLIGSVGGSVSMRAGNKLHITGSDIIAARDIEGIAKDVTIDASQTDRHHEETHEMKSSGFTLAVKSPVIDALQNLNRQARGAASSQDGRTAALHAIAAAGGMADLAGAAGGVTQALASRQKPEAKVELSFGASRSKTTFAEDSTQHRGSSVRAAGTAAFVATGDKDEGRGNVTIEGSDVLAKNIVLQANNRVDLFSSADTDSTRSTNESSSASVGVSFGTNGWGVSAAMSRAHGDANSDAVTRKNTHVAASDTVTIVSGGDTNIVGANVNAGKVIGEIGGNLNVASVQDTVHSVSHQTSTGGGFSVSQGGGSASISHQSGHASGNYAGVGEQSGIRAGAGGFDITVRGNTDLKGAYIASAAPETENRLTTGTLSFSDIRNGSSYEATSFGVSAGGGVGDGGNNYATRGPTTGKNRGGALPLAAREEGSTEAVTQSAISAGSITIEDQANQRQDIAMLNRDVTDLNGAVERLPDLQNVLSNQADLIDAAQAAAETIAKQVGRYAEKKQAQAARAAAKEADPALREQYRQDAENWAEGGKYRAALHMAGGALTGGLTGGGLGAAGGAAGAGLSAALAPKLDEIAQSIAGAGPTGNRNVDELLGNLTSNVLAGVAGTVAGGAAGALSSAATDRFNRQLSPDEKKAIKKGVGDDDDLEKRLTRAACYEVKCWAQYKPGSAEYTANYVSQLEASQLQAEFDWVKDQKQTGLFDYTPLQKVGDAVQSDPVGVAKDLVKVGAGLAAAKVGGVLCASAAGCGVGASMFVFGTSDAIEGSTSLHDRYYGVSSRGVNPLRWGFNQISPTWGDLAYDGISFGTALAGLKMPVPLNVGKADGLNRPTSMFGVSVQYINNVKLYPITKGATPTGTHQSTLLFGVGSKGLAVVEDIRELGRPE